MQAARDAPARCGWSGKNAGRKEGSRGRGILVELLEVALLDLLHHGFAAKQVLFELRRNLAWHDEKLIANHFWKRDRTAPGNEGRAPLEHQAGIPEDKAGEKNAGSAEGGAASPKDASETVEKDGEAQDKKRRERNKKTASIRRNARPIRIGSDEVIKCDRRYEKGSANTRHAAPEAYEADESEEKKRRPGKQAVIRRKQHGQKIWRPPEPLADGNV